MIADCETCPRKQVPCSACEESQRAICFICQGDIDDPYCELEETMNAQIHPAILKAQSLYDEPGDMTPAGEALLFAVHQIGRERDQTIKITVQLYGDLTQAYFATVFLANRHASDQMDEVLAQYKMLEGA
jgi:hypothetical protein